MPRLNLISILSQLMNEARLRLRTANWKTMIFFGDAEDHIEGTGKFIPQVKNPAYLV